MKKNKVKIITSIVTVISLMLVISGVIIQKKLNIKYGSDEYIENTLRKEESIIMDAIQDEKMFSTVDLNKGLYNFYIYTYHITNIRKDSETKNLKKLIDKYNKFADKEYQNTLNKKIDKNNCSEKQGIYRFSEAITMDPVYANTSDFVTISYQVTRVDFCKEKEKLEKPVTLIYSKELDKEISYEEFLKIKGITNEKLKEAFIESLKNNYYTKDLNYEEEYENTLLDGKESFHVYYEKDSTLKSYYYNSKTKSYDSFEFTL